MAEAVDRTDTIGPLLALLREASGLEVAFLSHLDVERDRQTVTHVDQPQGSGEFRMDVGTSTAWSTTLCREALASGTRWNQQVQRTWGSLDGAHDPEIVTYASVPVEVDGRLHGTLCVISPRQIEKDDAVLDLMRLCARLIGDSLTRDLHLVEARRRAEHAEETLRQRVTATAGLEHAMKTPLAVVSGWAETLMEREGQLSADQVRTALGTIRRHSARLLEQLQELLEGTYDAMTMTEAPAAVSLADIARELAPIVAPRSYEVVGDAIMHTDTSAVRVLIEHLVANAAHHTPPESRITVEITRDDGGVVLVVDDDGPGLPHDIDPFAAFVRGEGGGSGLGLHIVRSLATSLGGTITADASERGGARFTLRFPADT